LYVHRTWSVAAPKNLEKLGHVPENTTGNDWSEAERTTWWGKPLDPKEFWKDRPVWLDKSARWAAESHGRTLPPPPFDDPTLPQYVNEPHNRFGQNVDAVGPNLVSDQRENAFWAKWEPQLPRCPEDISGQQEKVAIRLVSDEVDFKGTNPFRDTAQSLKRTREVLVERSIREGFSRELFDVNVLYAVYVLRARREYGQDVQRGWPHMRSLDDRLAVAKGVVPENILIANEKGLERIVNDARTKYLERLSKEAKNLSYVQAYKKAWGL